MTAHAERPLWRRALARTVFFAALLVQLYFIVHAYWDPHVMFGFQPFNESSEWRADIWRVMPDGRRVSVAEPWYGYEWHHLVRVRGLGSPFGMHHADSGLPSVLDYLQHALDWVADHTPRDPETRYYEAEVTYFQNRRGPFQALLRSHDRGPGAVSRVGRLD